MSSNASVHPSQRASVCMYSSGSPDCGGTPSSVPRSVKRRHMRRKRSMWAAVSTPGGSADALGAFCPLDGWKRGSVEGFTFGGARRNGASGLPGKVSQRKDLRYGERRRESRRAHKLDRERASERAKGEVRVGRKKKRGRGWEARESREREIACNRTQGACPATDGPNDLPLHQATITAAG